MTEENRGLLRRIAGLEIAVKRLQMVAGGIVGASEAARLAVITCDRCDRDMEKVLGCEFEDCPCGVEFVPPKGPRERLGEYHD